MFLLMWLVALLCSLTPPPCRAGECGDSEKDYIACLTGNAAESRSIYDCLSCLACFAPDWRRWAGPFHAEELRRCRESPNRQALIRASIPLLAQEARTDSLRYLRHELSLVLASWGIDRVGDYEVYDAIVSEPLGDHGDYAQRMMALAGLRDPRTPAYVDATYDSIRSRPNWDPRFGPSAALNCLYFIPGAKAVGVAKKIAAKEKDPALRERAARVIARKN